MAIAKASDFTIYNSEFSAAVTETLTQNTEVFNAASAGSIVLRSQAHRGNYLRESFFATVASLVSRRDLTSVSAATDLALTSPEKVAVKINRKVGPAASTLDAWRKIMMDLGDNPETQNSAFSYLLGQQAAKAISADYVNTALLACSVALAASSSVAYDISALSPATISHTYLATLLSKMGDAANRIVCFVMHSSVYWQLVKQSITDKVTEVAGVVIQTGTPATFNRPVIVTDSAGLIDQASPTRYYTLGLTAGAVEVLESEGRQMFADLVTGLEQVVIRLQGEHAFTVGLKGFTWDVTHGGANPLDAAIGTSTNWDQICTDLKDGPGVLLKSQ
jgi:hypothetical protein